MSTAAETYHADTQAAASKVQAALGKGSSYLRDGRYRFDDAVEKLPDVPALQTKQLKKTLHNLGSAVSDAANKKLNEAQGQVTELGERLSTASTAMHDKLVTAVGQLPAAVLPQYMPETVQNFAKGTLEDFADAVWKKAVGEEGPEEAEDRAARIRAARSGHPGAAPVALMSRGSAAVVAAGMVLLCASLGKMGMQTDLGSIIEAVPQPLSRLIWQGHMGQGATSLARAAASSGVLGLAFRKLFSSVPQAGLSSSQGSNMDWYNSLVKPSFIPSGTVIGTVWNVLYGLMAASIYRMLTRQTFRSGERKKALWAWVLQLAFNATWGLVHFGLRSNILGFLFTCAYTIAVAVAKRVISRFDPRSGRFMLPTVLWSAFAAVMAGALAVANGY